MGPGSRAGYHPMAKEIFPLVNGTGNKLLFAFPRAHVCSTCSLEPLQLIPGSTLAFAERRIEAG